MVITTKEEGKVILKCLRMLYVYTTETMFADITDVTTIRPNVLDSVLCDLRCSTTREMCLAIWAIDRLKEDKRRKRGKEGGKKY